MLNLNLLRKELHEQRWVLILGIIIFQRRDILCLELQDVPALRGQC